MEKIIEKLPELATAYIKKYPPNTGYTIAVAQAIYDAYKAGKLPEGTNVAVQLALQYDGEELAGGDLVDVPGDENQLPYKASYSLDKGADCADFCRNIYLLLLQRNIGNWTEGIYANYKNSQVPWEERRAGDILLFKLSSRNPNTTHATFCIGDGMMLHTRTKKKPLTITADSIYSASKRTGTGVFRVLTDEEYEALIIGDVPETETEEAEQTATYSRLLQCVYTTTGTVNFRKGPGTKYASYFSVGKGKSVTYMGVSGDYVRVRYKKKVGYMHKNYVKRTAYMSGADVKAVQAELKSLGYFKGAVRGNYGVITAAAVVAYQDAKGLAIDGIVGPKTWASLFG